MRALIAATCVAILAAITHYFWAQYSEAQDRKAELAEIQMRIEAEKKARYTPWEGYFDPRETAEIDTNSAKLSDSYTEGEAAERHPCVVSVSRLRAIVTAKRARTPSVYDDDPEALRADIEGCIDKKHYTREQVVDVLE